MAEWSKVEVWKSETPSSDSNSSLELASLMPLSQDSEALNWQAGNVSATKDQGNSPQPSPEPSGHVPPISETDTGDSSLLLTSGRWKPITTMGNVYAIRYDWRNRALIVQYKHWAPPMPREAAGGPGPIYAYGNVSYAEARSAFDSPNVNQWLDANVKLNPETSSQHKKPYRLLKGSFGYVPRKAVWRPDLQRKEWYVERLTGGTEGSNHSSATKPARNRKDR